MRRILCCLLLLSASFAVPAAVSAQQVQLNPDNSPQLPSDPAGAMQAAREKVAAGNLDGAVIGLQTYVAGHPGEIGPERLLGDLYYRKTELSRAEQTYRHILSYAPNDKETHNRLGSVLATENRIEDAIAEFNRSLPGTDAIPSLIELHERRGDLQIYKRELDAIAQQYPNSSDAQAEAGEAYETLGEPEIAERYFRRALDSDPTSLIAMNDLGLALMDQARYSEAIAEFGTCLGRDPGNYACMENLGATYLHRSDWGRARVALDRAHSMQPERAEALIDLGYLADEQGDWKKAVALYVQAMTVYPYQKEAYINLGYTYNAHGLYQLAESALVKGLAVSPKNGALHFLLGDVYSRTGKIAQAAAEYRAAAVSQDLDAGIRRAAQDRIAALRTPKPAASPIH